ncbi:hypothetical protein K469DRAFT_234518 [Zopfia rhizophila CBS 207.26]|uniref:Uncharacterized protein n=1 Tax=Zopfia rhizophila CBS 207.26 TaxID=1314779 RepID=A0A6A6EQU2_9PEZI|nr:hypothetical protein K469DRAFT_234518 [Zopfia rhizophila CBS 207.26]
MAGRKKNPNRHKLGGSFWDEADEEDTSHPNNGHDSSTAGLNEGNASEKNSKPSSSSEPRTVASVEDDWGEWENVEDANRKASDGASRPRTARYSSGSDDLYSDVASTVPLKYSGNSDDSRYDYLSFRPRRRLTPVSSPRSKGKARSGYGIRSNRVPNSPPTFYSPYPQLFTGYPPTIPSFPGIHQAYGAQIPLSGYPSVPPVPSGGSERGSPAHVGGNHEAATLVSGRPQHAFPNFTDGLAFNVEVRCSYTTLNSRFSTAMQQYWPDQLAHAELGDLRVHSVLSSKRFKNRSGRHCIELACSNGPSHNQNTEQFQMHWLYV